MPSARELEQRLIERFDEETAISLVHALASLIADTGVGEFEAAEQAEKSALAVKRLLEKRSTHELPFDFGASDSMWLVGKRRVRSTDSELTRFARAVRIVVPAIHNALYRCSDEDFEIVGAAALAECGALDMVANCSGDDGGIDIYGRLPLRTPDVNLRPGLLESTLLPNELLVLGQCKRYSAGARIGRPDLQKFLGAVNDCLNQYEGNARPPSQRLPSSFYRRNEPCVKVFITTAEYADTGHEEAHANDVVLIEGDVLAQFLAARRIGVDWDSAEVISFSERKFSDWIQRSRERHLRQKDG
jgi:hypothetical protein